MIGHTFKQLKRRAPHRTRVGEAPVGPGEWRYGGLHEQRPRRAPRPRGWHNAGHRTASKLAEQMYEYARDRATALDKGLTFGGASITRRWPR